MNEAHTSSPGSARTGERALLSLILGGLAALSLWLAFTRVYQVDEAQNAYMAWLMGQGSAAHGYVSAPLFLTPFAWASRFAGDASTEFLQLRVGFCLVFWVNLMLLVKAAGFKVRSRTGGWALAALLLLPPLWTYGLEARHENIILMGLLLLWAAGRWHGHRRGSYAFLGLVAVLMQMCAFKAVAYWFPVTLGFLLAPPAAARTRGRLMLEWLLGAAVGCGIGLITHLLLGTLGAYLHDQAGLFQVAVHGQRFAPWSALTKLVEQTPLLLGLGVIPGAIALVQAFKTRRWTWDGPLPEVMLWLWAFVLLCVNPNPFPYNLVPLVACGALAVLAMGTRGAWGDLLDRQGAKPLLAGLLIFAQGIPFCVQAATLLSTTNDRQLRLMAWAEKLTDPKKDTVFDGVGLVPGRLSPTYYWFLNLTNVQAFDQAADGPLRRAIAKDAPAVLIPTYRFNYLDQADLEAIQGAYVPIAPDLFVLGGTLGEGTQAWECRHAGRYMVSQMNGAYRSGIRVDGAVGDDAPMFLARGRHVIEVPAGDKVIVEWVGPHGSGPIHVDSDGAVPGVFPIPNEF